MTLCEKYRASCFADIKGQDSAIQILKDFVKQFPKKRALLVHGPSGTGKTSLAYALASELNSEIFELNASHLRNREQLKNILFPAAQQSSLFEKGKVILVDEVEGVTSGEIGGLQALLEIIDATSFPIIITGNNIWDKKYSQLRQKCMLISLKELNYQTILNILEDIVKKENITASQDVLKSIAAKSRGDVRAALNDLQSIGYINQVSDIHERDKETNIFEALRNVFKNTLNQETLTVYDRLDIPTDQVYLWLEENIPAEYKQEELEKAYNYLSKADVFRGRIHRQQHWRFLFYQNLFLSAGIASSKEGNKTGFTKYNKPTRILKLWLAKQRNLRKATIAAKLAKATHTSKKQVLKEFYHIKPILNNPQVQKELKLSKEEITYLRQ